MSNRGRKYAKGQFRRQRQIYTQKAMPTENEGFPVQLDLADGYQEYDDLKSRRVPVEPSPSNYFVKFLKLAGVALPAAAILFSIIYWVVKIDFKVSEVESDIEEQGEALKSVSSDIQDIDVFHAEVIKDLKYLKEGSSQTGEEISSIRNKLDKSQGREVEGQAKKDSASAN